MTRIAIFVTGTIFGASCVLLALLIPWPAAKVERMLERPPLTTPVAAGLVPEVAAVPAQVEVASVQAAPAPGFSTVDVASPDFAIPRLADLPPTALPPIAPTAAMATFPPITLIIPVAGIEPGQLSDTFMDARGGGRVHDAIDIMAAQGTPVVAVDSGRVAKLFNSKQGGLTLYQFDSGETRAYYYAHLDRYASGVVEGQQLRRGDLIGYVGSTGNASPGAPHLHFAIFVLGPEKHWWQGTAINPYPLLVGHQ